MFIAIVYHPVYTLQELFKKEMDNLKLYGYGIKGFMLSMVECALKLSNYTIPQQVLDHILMIGKDMIDKPIELLDGVEEVLKKLHGNYKLILATKGDLLDQERKLEKSNAFSSASSIIILLLYSITIYSYRLFVLAKVGAAIFTLLALLGLFNCTVLVVVAVTASS